MRRALSLGILVVLATASQARTEDFTGAYAGVNAGYGFERGRDAKKPGVAPHRTVTAPASDDLPPSAARAARSLGQARPTGSR